MKFKSTKKTDVKTVAKATKIAAKPEAGGLFKRFLNKIKK
jgi:hypothetical protein